MALFGRRRRVEAVVKEWESLDPRDLATVALLFKALARPADIQRPRHVLHYLYLPAREAADAAAREARAQGWDARVEEPLPDGSGEWCVVAERPRAVLDPALVRGSRALFESVAARHGGTYDGWEAST